MDISCDLVVFDLMGTCFEDNGRVADVFTEVLMKYGVDPEAIQDHMRKTMGMSKPEVLGQIGHPNAMEDFRDHLIKSFYLRPPKLIDDVQYLIDWLSDQGIKFAFNTGFSRVPSLQIFEAVGWEHLRELIVCDSDVERGRPYPYMIYKAMELTSTMDVSKVCVIGDNPVDLQAGMNAQAGMVVGVKTGGRDSSDFPGINEMLMNHTSVAVTRSCGKEFSTCWLINTVVELPGLLKAQRKFSATS